MVFYAKNKLLVCGTLALFIMGGCATGPHQMIKDPNKQAPKETPQDVVSALEKVAGSLSGKELNEKEIKTLSTDIRANKDTQSALQSITSALGQDRSGVKYCPVDGKHFNPRVLVCPEHNVKLKEVEE